MARSVYAWRNGKFCEITPNQAVVNAPFVQSDELPDLRHPVTGKRYTSRRRYEKDTAAMGYTIVGDDLLSKRPDTRQEYLTDDKIMDAIEHAESIHSNPDKLRERQYENQERLARYRQLIHEE
ncbi:MAG TPA: hypothetical protein PLJ74_05395 [Myxococcota bacterium]|nr:hypothetical protein [Myxococcota bacterium]